MTAEEISADDNHQAPVAGWGTFEASGLGTLWLEWSGKGLRRLSFERLQGVEAQATSVSAVYADPLTRYFDGEPEGFANVPLDLTGTDFQLRVWSALREIPWGEVRTYGGVAHQIHSPRAMRAVGQANHVNPVPIIVPCHRVVEAGHHLGGYGGGVDRKQLLLALEGVRFHEGVVQPGQLELF
ncbi:MAG: methylated-DNA--[protein]-cysteine S-methyltransferase [Myxococcales bacterium]|nr:MAG: methylated-DNA--[protein]-cysteine S-methyltransferase [Myxococcales bacterium]